MNLFLLRETLLAALREDVGSGDVTAQATISANARATARLTTKQALVVSGIVVTQEIARLADPHLEFKILASEGASVSTGAVLAEIRGSARSILTTERTALNLLQRMCGIATLT